jgi:xylulokinase
MWHLMGVMLSAGGSLRWYRDTLGDMERRYSKEHNKDAYDLLIGPAAKIPAGCEGLLYLPYLSGERTPYPNPNARGVFFGLSLRHTKAHLTRAVLEGVAFGLRDSLELMRSLGIIFNHVRASGGGARSTLWRQIMADIFGTKIITTNVTEGAAFGAALLAGAGTGAYENIAAACGTVIKSTQEMHSGSDQSVYKVYYPLYRSLYSSLVSQFDEITALSTRSGIKSVNR